MHDEARMSWRERAGGARAARLDAASGRARRGWTRRGCLRGLLGVGAARAAGGCGPSSTRRPPTAPAPDPFIGVLEAHARRYPWMAADDLYKLIHQSVMGPAHLVDLGDARRWMRQELSGLGPPTPDEPLTMPLDPTRGLVRVHLRPWLVAGRDPDALLEAFVFSARQVRGDSALIGARCAMTRAALGRLGRLGLDPAAVSGARLAARCEALAAQGYPAIHHSPGYRERYAPAYRVVLAERLGLRA